MSISISKLQQFIEEKGFVIKTIYHSQSTVKFIKIVSIHLAEVFILTIPTNYSVSTKPEYDSISEEVEFFDVTNNTNLFVQNSSENSRELAPIIDSKIDQVLNEDYKKDIIINNSSKSYHRSYDKKIQLNSSNNISAFSFSLRLLNRLCYSVIDIPYDLAILHHKYLVVTNKENKDGYIIKNEHPDIEYQMFICFNIEIFYKSDIVNNSKHIYSCIYKLLDDNAMISFKKINNLNPFYKSNGSTIKALVSKKNVFLTAIKDLQSLITNIKKTQLENEEKLRKLTLKITSGESSSLHHDEYNTFEKQKINNELEKLEQLQLKSTQSILDTRLKVNNIVFTLDTVLFDNLIMLTNVSSNFDKLSKIKK